MFLSFTVSNFLSFKDTQTISMEAGTGRKYSNRLFTFKNLKITKFKAIYGANASGKTAFIRALYVFKRVIGDKLPAECREWYCKAGKESGREKPSSFEIRFILNERLYRYGFTIILSTGRINKEWLYESKNVSDEKCIFVRDAELGTYDISSFGKEKKLQDRLSIYLDDIKKDNSILLLKLLNQNKSEFYEKFNNAALFKEIYKYICRKITITFTDGPITAPFYYSNPEKLKQIVKMMSSFGTGISNIALVPIPVEKAYANIPEEWKNEIKEDFEKRQDGKEEYSVAVKSDSLFFFFFFDSESNQPECQTIEISHHGSSSVFDLENESEGTKRLLDLIEILICEDHDRIYIVDEINRSLHPLLTVAFVQQFLEYAAERNVQLLVTTHESKLMDQKILRRDEIGLITKNDLGESTYSSLDVFVDRFDKVLCNSYLEGAYNAIPIISFE